MNRRLFLASLPSLFLAPGCRRSGERPDLIWGERGVVAGKLFRPRAAVIDHEDRIFLVDFTARIQGFSREGEYLGHGWTTPDYRNGRPSGLGLDLDGSILVCDSHYHCIRKYAVTGELLETYPDQPVSAARQFGYVSDVVVDAAGDLYVSEFGSQDRITKMSRSGEVLNMWGREGGKPGEFSRARALAWGPDGLLYVADACNHRVQVFTKAGEFVRLWGEPGSLPGELSYPYDIAFLPDGNLVVAEYGNNRVQRFTAEGESRGTWGVGGRGPGELANPWAVVVDRRGAIHVVDTDNHRVQRIGESHFHTA